MRCAVLGSPIGHSLSPTLHTAAYAAMGLAWSYDAVEVSVAGLPAFLDGLDEHWRGLSLTMPLKRAVRPLLDDADEVVRVSGVANTVLLSDGRRFGANTDVPGAVAAVRERTPLVPERAVVLGGGATAASLLLALADLGCTSATLLVRDPSRVAETLAGVARRPGGPTVTVAVLGTDPGPVDLIASTIPASAQTPDLVALLDAPVIFDAIYDPWPTPLMTWAGESGRVLVSGLDLLVHQAALQLALMTGVADVPLAVMRRAGEQALDARTP